MIAHIVLFRPRSNLSESARTELAAALEAALRGIPSIRRARVGARVVHGRPYELLMRTDYSYAAVLEFDDLAGLKAYLEHPAHQPLASRLFETFEDVLIYDFEVQNSSSGLADVLGIATGRAMREVIRRRRGPRKRTRRRCHEAL